ARVVTKAFKALLEAEQAKLRAEEAKQARLDLQAEQEKREQERLAAEKVKREEEKRLAELRKKEEALAAQQKKEDEAREAKEQAKREQEQAKKAEEDARKKAAEQAKADADAKKALEAANKKLEAERARAVLEATNQPWMVQAAMAKDQAAADAVVAKLKAQGYPAQTSQTSRGVRVLIGPEKGRAAALALSEKVNQDPRVNIKGAWAINWQPIAEAAGQAKPRAETKKTESKTETPTNQAWMVQVAIAADDERAQAMAAKLKAQGYPVRTSQTTRGVRILVGPARDRDAALDLRNKVNQDPKLNINSAWVLNWQPPTS
ncbi:MAG: SPOR domain-containing protein, partial [Pseudomonadota bacterium]|nr:SPOR domain-containing protein [Pseudomonadota bacterium]